jgi:hypothetical protein
MPEKLAIKPDNSEVRRKWNSRKSPSILSYTETLNCLVPP